MCSPGLAPTLFVKRFLTVADLFYTLLLFALRSLDESVDATLVQDLILLRRPFSRRVALFSEHEMLYCLWGELEPGVRTRNTLPSREKDSIAISLIQWPVIRNVKK